MAGGADLIFVLTKAWRPPTECRQRSVHCLGDTNTCGHRFGLGNSQTKKKATAIHKEVKKRNSSHSQLIQYVAHRLGEEISYALFEAGLVVVVLLPRDQGERVQDLHDDLKEVGRRNLWKAERILSLTAKSSPPGIHQRRTR